MASAAVQLGLLLPPSEGKAGGGNGPIVVGRTRPIRRTRARVARRWSAGWHGCEAGTRSCSASAATISLRPAVPTLTLATAPSLPAWQRYTGVVWGGLDVASLPTAASRRAMSSVIVVSGLLGLAALDDPIPEYRLKMSASLAPYGKLSTWWRPALAESLTTWAAQRFVVDLLPNEHRAACESAEMRGVRGRVRRTRRQGRRTRRQGRQGSSGSPSADRRADIRWMPCSRGATYGFDLLITPLGDNPFDG